jgi:DNA repair protein SbcD/Mre11
VAQFEPLDVLRWESWIIDASGCQDDYEVLVQASRGLSALLADCDGRALAVRVEVRGRTAAHDKLIVQRRQWTEELRSLTQDKSAGNVWIEKVCFQTSPPRDLDESAWADGPLGEVRRYIQELQTDKEAIGRLGGELADLRRKLPAELKEADDLAALENPDYLARLLDDVGPLLVSRLIDGGGVEKGGA